MNRIVKSVNVLASCAEKPDGKNRIELIRNGIETLLQLGYCPVHVKVTDRYEIEYNYWNTCLLFQYIYVGRKKSRDRKLRASLRLYYKDLIKQPIKISLN